MNGTVQVVLVREGRPPLRFTAESPAEVKAVIESEGFTFSGSDISPYRRTELRGMPRFSELAGPMWDGGAIRYEDWRVNDALSK